ncbi:predicted protein [Phaeodactylum tricornutum CCAP 1055/1]|uniref:Dehydrogenase E1 component domain-containing protein n=2 Tax=Phaeodactylum tricornutum TaxID=2850 RepID=B7G5T3_PHATC|nr:predicted protein [Phaeodactylum tricornutum CCAP 1055/1]EEC45884.1 predicted protein [Phaeodactylum tricornutum CCAP 1055/1]|eukprot:XP_002182597.1 predicted protein [Phaeodactylum tricornutum CCAP 1055/1]
MKFLTLHPAANSFLFTTNWAAKATLGFDIKGDQHEVILSQRGFVGICFYSQAAEEISDNEEPHEPLFSGKAAGEQALGLAQCILEKKMFSLFGHVTKPVSLKKIRNVLPILLHGDATFAGQGVVYETMQMAEVPDFDVGGTIHAFTCPIFHCNGNDPLAVSTALETAVEWRHEWGMDVIIEMVCYRCNGHNKLDQPAFTQPKLYKEISQHPPTLEIVEK